MAVEKQSAEGTSPRVDMAALRSTVMSLMEKIQSGDDEEIKKAVVDLRLLAKWDMANRTVIGELGGIPLIMSLLGSSDSKVQENAVTTLLNCSIYPENRIAIMEAPDALESISEVLRAGASSESRENAAALLASVLIVEKYRDVVGRNSGIVGSLRDLVRNGGHQGKKDALKAIFHLALWPGNRSRLALAGLIVPLMGMLRSPKAGLIEDTLSVLSQIARCTEGTDALKDPPTISLIVDFLSHGSRLAKENACSLLLSICQTGGDCVGKEVRKHRNTIVGVLCTLISVGTPRAKGKANDLMKVMVVSGSIEYFSGTSV